MDGKIKLPALIPLILEFVIFFQDAGVHLHSVSEDGFSSS